MIQIERSTIAPGALAVIGFTPQQGSIGQSVTIQGQGFSATPAGNAVLLNGTAATVTSATAGTLVVTVPADATTGPIAVTVNGVTATSTTNFTVLALPAITSITPNKVNLGTSVPNLQVSGVNLSGSTFSFLPAFSPAAITINSASVNIAGTSAILNLTIGARPPGSFTLVATNAAGSSSAIPVDGNTLQILDPTVDVTPPSVSLTTPTSGASLSAGQTITVSATAGDNVGVTRVDFT